jgi:hypothetical protein
MIELLLFENRAIFHAAADEWAVRRSDVVSPNALWQFNQFRKHAKESRAYARKRGSESSPAFEVPATPPVPDVVPDRTEMELAICQALGLVELLTEKALAATKENGSCLAVRTESGLVELSSNTCQRLRAAFYGRAA